MTAQHEGCGGMILESEAAGRYCLACFKSVPHEAPLDVLVWKVDPISKYRHLSLVPASEAHKHERYSKK